MHAGPVSLESGLSSVRDVKLPMASLLSSHDCMFEVQEAHWLFRFLSEEHHRYAAFSHFAKNDTAAKT